MNLEWLKFTNVVSLSLEIVYNMLKTMDWKLLNFSNVQNFILFWLFLM